MEARGYYPSGHGVREGLAAAQGGKNASQTDGREMTERVRRYQVLAATVRRWVRGEIPPCLRTARQVNALWEEMTAEEREVARM